MNKKWISILALQLCVATTSMGSKDPIGETANYKLDKDPKRTSSMINSGKMKVTVAKAQEMASGPGYVIDIDYVFNVNFLGNQTGAEYVTVEKEFFTEEFIVNLREKKHYEGAYYKADHVGYADAKTMEGKLYKNCDKVLLYDMKSAPKFLVDLFADITDGERAKIQNMKALVHVYPGIPAMGGAKIDVTGKSSGQNVKVGADYVSQ